MSTAALMIIIFFVSLLPADGGPPVDLASIVALDLINYRVLQRRDFHGAHAPRQFLHTPVLPVAVSCVHIVVDPRARITAATRHVDGQTIYQPTIDNLVFRAVFSRACSWWNTQHDISPAYVLEHEQIHFGLYEVAARRLNQQTQHLSSNLPTSTQSRAAAISAARRYLHETLERTRQQVMQENARFDRETSFGFQPQRQTRWRLRTEQDLRLLVDHVIDFDLPRKPPAP